MRLTVQIQPRFTLLPERPRQSSTAAEPVKASRKEQFLFPQSAAQDGLTAVLFYEYNRF